MLTSGVVAEIRQTLTHFFVLTNRFTFKRGILYRKLIITPVDVRT